MGTLTAIWLYGGVLALLFLLGRAARIEVAKKARGELRAGDVVYSLAGVVLGAAFWPALVLGLAVAVVVNGVKRILGTKTPPA